jgi:hypothetical protein
MSILAGNMTYANASNYLSESGYGQKWVEQLIRNKKKRNEACKTRVTKTGTEPQLEEEVAINKFTGDFKERTAAARAKRNFDEYLLEGKPIPPPLCPTNVRHGKVDSMIRWFVEQCGQFRPGKTRNVQFRGVTLKKLPFYICYGSYKEMCTKPTL